MKNINPHLVLLILSLSMTDSIAEIYKWTDEQGNVHYGDKPNEKADEVQVDISKKGHISTDSDRQLKRKKLIDAFNQDREYENKQKAEAQKKSKKIKKTCARAKDQLKNYVRARALYDLDEEGNRVIISDEERNKSTQKLKNNIEKYCN